MSVMKKSKKYILVSSVVVIAIAVIVATMVWNKPHENIKDAIAVKTDAITLYKRLAHDSIRAKAIFVNKVVAVSGKVKLVTNNLKKEQVVLLQTNMDDGAVNCTMEKNIPDLKVGDTVSLKGICLGYAGGDSSLELPGDVFLVRCYPVM